MKLHTKVDYIYHDLQKSRSIACFCRHQVSTSLKLRITHSVFLTLLSFLCNFLSRSLALLVRHGSCTISKNQLFMKNKTHYRYSNYVMCNTLNKHILWMLMILLTDTVITSCRILCLLIAYQ